MAGSSMTMDFGEFKKMTGKVLKGMKNTVKLTSAIGEMGVSSVKQRFRDEEAPDGDPWEKSGRAEAKGGQTLTDKAILKNSHTYEATSTEVAVGSNDIRAAIHHFGGEITPKNGKFLVFSGKGGKKVFVKKVVMPARPAVGFSEDDIEEMKDITSNYQKKMFGVK